MLQFVCPNDSQIEAIKNKMVWELYLLYPIVRLLALPLEWIKQ